MPARSAGAAISARTSVGQRAAIRFAVMVASRADASVWVSLFDDDGDARPTGWRCSRQATALHTLFVAGLAAGARYGLRADGDYAPERGLWFDPDKLLVDPYAVAIDRPYAYDCAARGAARRGRRHRAADAEGDRHRAAAGRCRPSRRCFTPGGLIYEAAGPRLHHAATPKSPRRMRGTVAALAHPAIIEHLQKLGVVAVELMPVTAWIDERHLPPLGLSNAWGYNPVTFMALDPRLAPGGLAELRDTVAALRDAGIGVILDLVFNHTGESDRLGPTLSLRGLDNHAYYRHAPDNPGVLVNDTGTGNTLACDHPAGRRADPRCAAPFRAAMPASTASASTSRPCSAAIGDGFDPEAPLLRGDRRRSGARRPRADRRALGHRAGRLPARQFPAALPRMERPLPRRCPALLARRPRHGRRAGDAACRLVRYLPAEMASRPTRTVNFIAAHDGLTLADLVAYERKHNEANGEHNRDGHNENLSWNNGVEGETADAAIIDAAHARPPRAAGDAVCLARHDHADGRRRVRPHPARQQQRLCAGQ